MVFRETPLTGAFLIELEKRADERGFFARTWCRREFEEKGLDTRIAQCSTSFNERRGTLRGLHYQAPPHAEVKLVRCTRGALYDVIVDIRPESPTYLAWFGAELTAENGRMLYIPEGVAHGFQTLADGTEVFYQISKDYAPDAARGLRWDDPALGIDWPQASERILSEKDRSWPDLALSAPAHSVR